MMRVYHPVRLGDIQADFGAPRHSFATRVVKAPPSPAARPLRTGVHSLALMNLPDSWRPWVPQDAEVHTIADAMVQSSAGIVGLPDGRMIEDTLDHSDPLADGYERLQGHALPTANGELRPEGGLVRVPPPRRHLSLLMPGSINPFHWLIMNLARVGLLEAADIAGLTGILVPAGLGPVQRDSLNRDPTLRHLPRHRVARGSGLTVDSLVHPWRVAPGDGMHPAGISYLRRLYPVTEPRRPGAPRRIYVDRRGSATRVLSNESEVARVLAARGFACVRLETLTMSEQARLFREAELVVAPHGAGLANMAFAAPGLRVVELLPDGVMNWCYRHLAAASGHDYDCVIGLSTPGPDPSASRLWSGWTVSATHVLSSVVHHGDGS